MEHGLHDRQQVAGPVVELAHKHMLALLRLLALGDVEVDSGEAYRPLPAVADDLPGGERPADRAVRADEAKLAAEAGIRGHAVMNEAAEPFAILRMHVRQSALQ